MKNRTKNKNKLRIIILIYHIKKAKNERQNANNRTGCSNLLFINSRNLNSMNKAEKYKKAQLKNLEFFKEGGNYVISEGLMEATIEAVYLKGVSDGFTEGIK